MDNPAALSHACLVSSGLYQPSQLDLQQQHQAMSHSLSMPPTLRSQPAHPTSHAHHTPSRQRRALEEASTNVLTSSSASEKVSPPMKDEYSHDSYMRKQRAALKLDARKKARTERTGLNTAVVTHEPYEQYRARQRRDTAAQGELKPVWSEDLELAFMEAIEKIPKLGRRKLTFPDGKPRGRNELIADYIYRATGVHRTRKQVSSHIQVLKNLLKHDRKFMKCVTSEDPSNYTAEEKSPEWDMESLAAMSELPTPSLSTHSSRTGRSNSTHDMFASPPPSASTAHFPVFSSDALRLAAFTKWVGPANENGGVDGCFHKYTSLSTSSPQQPAVQLSSIDNWATRFPHLDEIQDQLADSQVLLLSASISTLTTTPPVKSLLCTLLEVEVPPSHKYYSAASSPTCGSVTPSSGSWECITKIYAPGKKVWELTHKVVLSAADAKGTGKLTLPFVSEFWSAFYTGLSQAQEECTDRRRKEKEAKAAIKGITVVQELWCTRFIREREAVLLWEFSKADPGCCGVTTWREVIVPPPTAQMTPVSSTTQQLPHAHVHTQNHGGAKLEEGISFETGGCTTTPDWSSHLSVSPVDYLSPTSNLPPSYFPFDESLDVDPDCNFDPSTQHMLSVDIDAMNMQYFQPAPQQQPQQQPQQHQEAMDADFTPYSTALMATPPLAPPMGMGQYLGTGGGGGGEGGDATGGGEGAAWPQDFSPVSPVGDLGSACESLHF